MADATNGRQNRADGEASRARIHRFLADYIVHHAISPTYAEIAAGVGLKPPTVLHHLRTLESRGVLRIGYGARSISLLIAPDSGDA